MIRNLNQENRVEAGLKDMRQYYAEFYEKQKGSSAVRTFLAGAFNDETILLRYLIGRKYRPKHAWDTALMIIVASPNYNSNQLRSYAEMRFDKYPEMFPTVLPPNEYLYFENQPIFGFLKERDSKGRRIAYFQLSGWDTNKCSLEELSILTLPIFEKALCDEDCLNNGLIFVQDNLGMGMEHAKHYTMGAMLRFLNIYWYSFPMKVKGVYFVNMPPFLTFLYAMIKPFLPKKLTERFLLSTTSRGFKDLHERLSPSILPRCLGGNLEADEAIDPQFLEL